MILHVTNTIRKINRLQQVPDAASCRFNLVACAELLLRLQVPSSPADASSYSQILMLMRTYVLLYGLVMAMLSGGLVQAQFKVLLIGNSYTSTNDLPGMLAAIFNEAAAIEPTFNASIQRYQVLKYINLNK